jgi:hypothetical protein
MNEIISVNLWPDTETTSVVEIVVATTVDDAIGIADAIAHALDVWHDERVDMRVCGVDRARYLLERNQEVAL